MPVTPADVEYELLPADSQDEPPVKMGQEEHALKREGRQGDDLARNTALVRSLMNCNIENLTIGGV